MAYSENYFLSKNVHVFPCAYRRQDGDTNTIFDPEARLNTERNLTNVGLAGESYTVSYTDGSTDGTEKLCVVIGGYYFEISETDTTNTSIKNRLENKYLCISLDTKATIGEHTTTILQGFESDTTLDKQETVGQGNPYYFVALKISDTVEGSSQLKVFDTNGNLDYTKFLPKALKSGSAGDDNTPKSLVLGSGTNTGDYSFSIGSNNIIKGKNSIAVGSGIKVVNDNNLVVGSYNNYNEDQALGTYFVVGNGTSTSHTGNAFVVRQNATEVCTTLSANKAAFFGSTVNIQDNTTIFDPAKLIAPRIDVKNIYGNNSDLLLKRSDTASAYIKLSNDASTDQIEICTKDGCKILTTNGSEKYNTIELDKNKVKIDTDTFKVANRGGLAPIFSTTFTEAATHDTADSTDIKIGDYRTITVQDEDPQSSVRIYKSLHVSDGYVDNFIVYGNGSFGTRGVYGSYTAGNNGDRLSVSSAGSIYLYCVENTTDYHTITVKKDTADNFYVTNNGNVYAAGKVTAPSFCATSDKRLKTNIEVYEPKKSILDLNVYKYDFITGPKNQIGCIAQELQSFCPEIVHEDENGFLSIQESKIVYLLLEEVKKLRKEVDELRGK